MKRTAKRVALSACVLLAAVGCNRSPYETASVRGVVKIDGVPFTEGSIVFSPLAQGENKKVGKPAYGELMPDGTFTLSTYGMNDGAVVGSHRASISSDADDEYSFDEKGRRVLVDSNASFGFLEIFDKTFDVKSDGENQFTIEITTDYIKKFGQWDD